MTWKVFGAVLVFLGCGSAGFMKVVAHQREEAALRQLMMALDYMECELQYRLPPLPQLCRKTAEKSEGDISKILYTLAEELDTQIAPDVRTCMHASLQRMPKLPCLMRENLVRLGDTLGQFDLSGQVRGLDAVREMVKHDLERHCDNKDARLRCYRTLGLCAGAALVVLLF